MQQMIEICNILLPYCTDQAKKYGVWAEHDIIGFAVDLETIPKEVLKKLDEQYGVFYDDHYNSLIKFV